MRSASPVHLAVLCAAVILLANRPAAAQAPPTAHADSLLAAGDLAGAIAGYRAVLATDSTIGAAWYRLGVALRRAGRYEPSLEALHRVRALGGPPVVLFELARSHAHLQHADSTMEWLRQAIAAGYGNPAQVDTLRSLAGLPATAELAGLREAADRLARPCEYDPNFRQFDFWVGEWDVTSATGLPQGTNHIQKMSNGCMLLESWTNVAGVDGHSINYYDGVLGKYVQVWVGAAGGVIRVEGQAESEGVMVFEGEIRGSAGGLTPMRGRYTLLEDGRVRQLLETSPDSGRTWAVWFDGYYRRTGQTSSRPTGNRNTGGS